MSNLDRYKNKLKSYLGEDLYRQFELHNVMIGGGMITSLFTNSQINDVDVYFRDEKSIIEFAENNLEGNFIISHTKKATMYAYQMKERDVLVQLIYYKCFKDAEELFKSFDFTMCMGVYDFWDEKFKLHDDFLLSNASKTLRFNVDTDYPLISAIRVHKYEQRGYSISKPEYFNILLATMRLDIQSYDELKDHIGGMYGVDYDELFDDVRDKEFSLDTAIEILKEVSDNEPYFHSKKGCNLPFNQILSNMDRTEINVIEMKGCLYRLTDDYLRLEVRDISNRVVNVIEADEFFGKTKFYKFVKQLNGKLVSYFDNEFEYEFGNTVTPNDSGNGLLYFNYKSKINKSTYYTCSDKVLIEVEINGEDVLQTNENEIRVGKAKILREVPEEEWSQWVNKDFDIF